MEALVGLDDHVDQRLLDPWLHGDARCRGDVFDHVDLLLLAVRRFGRLRAERPCLTLLAPRYLQEDHVLVRLVLAPGVHSVPARCRGVERELSTARWAVSVQICGGAWLFRLEPTRF